MFDQNQVPVEQIRAVIESAMWLDDHLSEDVPFGELPNASGVC